MKKKPVPQKYREWIDARQQYHLSHAQIQMARELGMTPKSLRKLSNTGKNDRWKAPLPQYLAHLYHKRFGKSTPDNVRSIEQLVRDQQERQEAKKELKQARSQENMLSNQNNVTQVPAAPDTQPDPDDAPEAPF